VTSFKYRDLQSLTKNFSDKLGGGAFGSVFRGQLPDGTAIAVKKLEGLRQGEKQFRAEVSTLGTIQHVNLIRLLGFCSEGGDRKLLVYEFMPKGSLDRHLFGATLYTLSWRARYHIAVGVAKGLAYLHDKCRDCIIHCDVKPENILLGADFAPKVADFGLAKLVGRDFSRVLTTMRGTIGYLAPEWIGGEAITNKADVFSYGMMLFEIVSGRRNVEHGRSEPPDSSSSGAGDHAATATFFPVLAARRLAEAEGDVMALLDQELGGDANVEEVRRVCKVACWCIQHDVGARPTMAEVVQALEGLTDCEMPPVPRYLEVLAGRPMHTHPTQ
jgi:serine/threonine protein kinase